MPGPVHDQGAPAPPTGRSHAGCGWGARASSAAARKTLRSAGTTTLTLKVAKKARRRFSRLRSATVTLNVRRSGTTHADTEADRLTPLSRDH